MECVCFNDSVDDYAEILFDKIVKARKNHRCHECGKTISIGEKYRFEKSVYDGNMSNHKTCLHKTCLDCNSVRKHLVCDFYWGDIWDLINESIRECGDLQPWAKIGRLTPVARKKVCDLIEDLWQDED